MQSGLDSVEQVKDFVLQPHEGREEDVVVHPPGREVGLGQEQVVCWMMRSGWVATSQLLLAEEESDWTEMMLMSASTDARRTQDVHGTPMTQGSK